ncbi:MAG: 3-hydroxyacyl-CoA dehydrogenase NAD-binding domain-containing protein, partial [Pseudomonadota bacterium]
MIAVFTCADSFEAAGDADLVVEAVFEDMAIKQDVFAKLDGVTKPDAVLATNTSYLDVNQIALSVAEPSRVLGLHFFSPAHIVKLLEVIRTDSVASDVLATGFALAKKLRKIAVPAGVCDGFIGNRIMSAYRRQCDFMLEDGALPQQIDEAMVAFGFPMGLFAMQDMAGLDISWATRKRQAATRDPNARYVAIADKLCEMGRFGRKSGAGWYDYSADPKKGQPDPVVEGTILAESATKGIQRKPFGPDDIMQTILEAMQQEGSDILAEGIATSPEAIDVVMTSGYGFPRWRGGPMFMQEAGAQTNNKEAARVARA